jgi:hypothetical protein
VVVLTAVCALAAAAGGARGAVTVDIESGVVASGYNDMRIPGDTGTLFSLSEDLSTDPDGYVRARVEWAFGDRHAVSVLYAPLTLTAAGTLGEDVTFADEVFPAGAEVEGTYTFNSYRLTYRYTLAESDRFEAGVGFTAKIRDALIRVEGGGQEAEKKNVGFVPLVNFRLAWDLTDRVGLLLEGDALAAPQGRAEDVLAAVVVDATDRVRLRLGYRIVEGGADNDEVYTFALLNYASAAVIVGF